MATAGWLIARAAQQPEVLELTVGIVLVRFFGLARPIARYLERLTSHDVAFRALAGIRTRFYQRIEPLAPAELGEYRSGDLLSRMVADVDTLQNLHLRGLAPPAIALLAGWTAVIAAAVMLPDRGRGAGRRPARLGDLGAAAGSGCGALGTATAEARGTLSAEVVELLRAAPELAVHGAEQPSLARLGVADGRVAQLSRREGVVAGATDGLAVLITGLTVVAVLAVAVSDHAGGGVSGVWVATLGLLALASFEAVARAAAGRSGAVVDGGGGPAGARVDRPRAAGCVTQPDPIPAPPARPVLALDHVSAGYGDEPSVIARPQLSSRSRAAGSRWWGPAAPARPRWSTCCCGSSIPRDGPVTLDGHDLRRYRLEDVRRRACRRRSGLACVCDLEHSRERPAGAARCDRCRHRRRASAGAHRRLGGVAARRAWTRWWGRRAAGSREASGSASRSPGRCWWTRPSWCWTSPPRISIRTPPPA